MTNRISLTCVSWIDQSPLPKVGFWLLAGASVSWAKRVIMGLVGTSNPPPSEEIQDVQAFARMKQYRALLSCVVELQPAIKLTDIIIDPGYTPPFDKSKIDTAFSSIAPIPDDPDFYAGEMSPNSEVFANRLHPCSSLAIKKEYKVIVSALIKFRAGTHTDKIGIEKAKSPVHVPWVWSEFALVVSGSTYRLLCNGSVFPSHAWYVNGQSVAKSVPAQITVSEQDPILNTGQPAGKLQTNASIDRSTEPIGKHAEGLGPGKQFDLQIAA